MLPDLKSLLRRVVPSTRTTVVGGIDGVHRGYTRGWAFDKADPTSRLSIRMVDAAGRVIAEALADRYRADVQKAGYGDGHYGFAVPVSDPALVATARFLCGRTGAELPRPRPNTGKPAGRTFNRGGYVLRVDQHPAGPALTGWAIDRHHPEERRLLRLRAGRRTLAEQRASLYRGDCTEANGDGFHGFSLPLSPHTGSLFVDDLASGLEFRIS